MKSILVIISSEFIWNFTMLLSPPSKYWVSNYKKNLTFGELERF
jgi:hypothetical protein